MNDAFDALLRLTGTGQAGILLALFLFTFVLEDVATLAGAWLAASGTIDVKAALLVLGLGVFLGDLGLYAAGALARRLSRLRAWVEARREARVVRLARQRLPLAVVLARLTPGLRLPAYTCFGLWRLDFGVFAVSCALSVAAWTSVFFGAGYWLGETARAHLGDFHLLGFGLAAVLAVLSARGVLRHLTRGEHS